MTTKPAPGDREREVAAAPRAQAPIRWPRPDRFALGWGAVWVVGVIIALAIPAFIVSPGEKSAPVGPVLAALGTTMLGAAVMLLAAWGLWRRYRDPLVFVMGGVPAIACVAGGIMLAATKVFTG